MTHGSGLRLKPLMLVTLLVLCAAPVRAERPAFMNAFDQWQVDEDADAMSVVLSPDGKHVYVARNGSYYISHF
jgi:hypothetical protein